MNDPFCFVDSPTGDPHDTRVWLFIDGKYHTVEHQLLDLEFTISNNSINTARLTFDNVGTGRPPGV